MVLAAESITKAQDALRDIAEAIDKHHLATTFGWQDVAQRYRRSRVGAFWLTINMGVLIGALGLIFGNLFRSPMQEYLPFICSGVIIWGFISSCLNEGCTSFISAEAIILQVRMPLFTHILRTAFRNMVIFAHNLVIFPIVILVLGRNFSLCTMLSIVGFIFVSLNLLWMMLVLGVVCARYRDLTQVIQNLLQVFFYITPVMWQIKTLPETASRYLFDLNPFYHLVTIVREPLLGEAPAAMSWSVVVAMMACGWVFAIWFFGRYRQRIAYWL
ncbi:ABC transporter permease [Mesorhizobium sp. M3A.F.Ca.ET.080.04.2.1]|uniref:ABC transporter permease n=1 Tax=Mesorhizobium sp. M3A.F.Ca.ET.080.04.2.1 TaxID=2493676 RepID=UPI001FDFEE14|nr:ABC transporter permease [Mesorhizobium sp. M3A.F.Ca.ET.080.04.2.1]